jgi:hypothetical protein
LVPGGLRLASDPWQTLNLLGGSCSSCPFAVIIVRQVKGLGGPESRPSTFPLRGAPDTKLAFDIDAQGRAHARQMRAVATVGHVVPDAVKQVMKSADSVAKAFDYVGSSRASTFAQGGKLVMVSSRDRDRPSFAGEGCRLGDV